MLSLARDLYRHGRRVSREGEAASRSSRTHRLCLRPPLAQRGTGDRFPAELYKIGFSQGPVEKRIRNAEQDPDLPNGARSGRRDVRGQRERLEA